MYNGIMIKKKKNKAFIYTLRESWNYIKICATISSVHSLNHLLTKKTLAEKLFWAILILLALSGYITLADETWYRYQVNPTVITLELDYQNWNITFPTMTMCPGLKDDTIDLYLASQYQNSTYEEKEELKNYFKKLYAPFSFRDFDKIHDFNKLKKEDYLDTLLNISDDFFPEVSATFYKTQPLKKVITEMGICHTYNSEMSLYFSPSYWKDDRWDLVDTSNTTIQVVANSIGGLTTTLSFFDHNFMAYFHSYNEVIDYASVAIHVKSKGIAQIRLKLINIGTKKNVAELKPSQRKCRLTHESNLKHSPVYSYKLCRIECRIQLCLKYCDCLPYFYRHLEGEKICDPKGMRCLSRYSDILETFYDKEKNVSLCNCMPNCNEDISFIEFIETGDWIFGSSIAWTLVEFPRLRYWRGLIFGLTNVLIYIGGMAGLFLGCGILSFVEIFYFLTLKLFWYIYNKREQNNISIKSVKNNRKVFKIKYNMKTLPTS